MPSLNPAYKVPRAQPKLGLGEFRGPDFCNTDKEGTNRH